MYQSDSFKHDVADRLLKLLMISRIHKLPLRVIEALRWDLGLPHDYVKSIVPEFPDYFRVVGTGNNAVLELVCWCSELAVSVLEKKGKRKGKGKGKGKGLENEMELEFPVQFSSGFEMDKKYEKWLKEWNKLAYVSPYEDATYLPASSDESDKWVVGVLHEILNLLVSKKTEKDNVLMLGEWLGLASRFKRVMLQHPGIFYLSNKIGTYTVVLKEGYKRGLLIEDHHAMELRRKYIHLMNTVKEDGKTSKVVVKGKSGTKESSVKDSEGKRSTNESSDVKDCEGREGEEDDDEISEEDASEWSDDETEDENETVVDDEEKSFRGTHKHAGKRRGETIIDDDEEKSFRGTHKTAANRRDRDFGEMKSSMKRPLRDSRRERSDGKFTKRTGEKNPLEESSRIEKRGGHKDFRDSRRERSDGKFMKKTRGETPFEGSNRIEKRGGRKDVDSSQQRSRYSKTSKDAESSQQRLSSSKTTGRSLTTKKAPV